jgi:hypothetical protein
MFATLVVQFPSRFTGGAFVVRHRGIERCFLASETDSAAAYGFHFFAHYADCEQEIKEVTSGVRLTAVFSLRWKGDGPPPRTPVVEAETELAKQLLLLPAGSTIGYMLDYHYTTASLARYGIRALKGDDRAIADGLCTAGALMDPGRAGGGLEVHIAKGRRYVYDNGEGNDLGTGPRLASDRDDTFRLDGSPAGRAAVARLPRLRFYDDVVNRLVWADGDYDNINDRWWGDGEGTRLAFAGNEGGDGEQTYYAFLLTAWRAGEGAGEVAGEGAGDDDAAGDSPSSSDGEGSQAETAGSEKPEGSV